MPPGEEMFKFHGYSGNCPKPPLPRPPSDTERLDWLDKHCAFVADHEYNIGPFKVGELRKMADAGISADKANRDDR
jgi:hypothetical protein